MKIKLLIRKNTVNKNKYYIKVNYGAQVVNIYTYDEKGSILCL